MITKKIEYNNYQSQQRDKTSQDQDVYPPGTCVINGRFDFGWTN